MAVAIFGHNDFGEEDNSEDFEYTPVSGEHSFITLWEPAIVYLDHQIGQRYLFEKRGITGNTG